MGDLDKNSNGKNSKSENPDPLDFLIAELKHKTKVRDALKESIYGKKNTNTNSKQPV